MEVVAGIIRKMEERSEPSFWQRKQQKDEAVTKQEANFDEQELNWIDYGAGGLLADVKKTACTIYQELNCEK